MRDLAMETVLKTFVPQLGMTVKECFRELLCRVWEEGEDFSGKKPLGTSDWQYIIICTLAETDALTSQEITHYNKLIRAAIRYMTI